MSGEDEAVTVVLRVAAELERLGIDYFVGGSVASSVHGRPRTTDDVDLVAQIAGRQVEMLVRALEKDFYVDAEMIHDAIQRRASFNLIHLGTMLKVDVFIFSGPARVRARCARARSGLHSIREPIWPDSIGTE